ncbi:MAG: RNA polymerase sigma factor [Defluviitaleaceae bacterium]|nr:RNA polymerase sigma factor [Defluviitaleaceae bacterium]
MDAAEFENFLTLYEKDIYTFCRYLAKNQQAAEDLYQETVLFAFEKRDDIDAARNPKSFLLAVAAGKWKSIVRKASRRANIAPEFPLEPNIIDTAQTPAQLLEQKELTANVIAVVNRLNEKLRIPLILHYYNDFSIEEIAAALEIPAGTVKSRLHKARKTLKNLLEKEGINGYRE